MLTEAEQKELKSLRQEWAFPLRKMSLQRLIELERKDAACMCPVCEIEQKTERMLASFLTVDSENFNDQQAKAEPDIADHLMVFTQGPTNAQTPTRQATPKTDAGHEDRNDGPKEPAPNFRTCGVARAKPEVNADVIPALFDLAALSLRFGRTNRITYHEDGVTPESDTDHTVMLGLCACAFAERFAPRLDLGLVAQFAFVHDLAEALCGDTNTLRIDQAGREEKERREEIARQEIRDLFSMTLPWVSKTLDRYERLEDPEARFVKVLDKVLPKITHALNQGAALREHGVDLVGLGKVNGSQREAITQTYGADQQEAVALLFAVHEELVRRLTR